MPDDAPAPATPPDAPPRDVIVAKDLETMTPEEADAIPAVITDPRALQDLVKLAKKKGKKKGAAAAMAGSLGTDRGVETMFRTSYRVNMDLSSLADSKANMMVSTNALLISIVVGAISSKIDSNPWLVIPTAILLLGCLVSLVYAVLAARPRVRDVNATLDDVRAGKANLLFFGTYASMTADEYEQGMIELVRDTDRLYRSMIRDIFGVGSVLKPKYKRLRVSYGAFMVGVVTGVIGFIIVYAMIWAGVIAGGDPALVEPTTGIFP